MKQIDIKKHGFISLIFPMLIALMISGVFSPNLAKGNELKKSTPVGVANILGRPTRLVLSCKDVVENMAWWSRIGFRPTALSGRPDSALTMVDGQIAITLIKDRLPSPIIMFASPDIRQLKDTLEFLGIPTTYDVGGPTISELRLVSPSGVHIAVRPEAAEPVIKVGGDTNMFCGKMTELSIGAAILHREQQFWQTLGFAVRQSSLMPYPFANLSDGVVEIGIHENKDIITLAMTYHSADAKERIKRIKDVGVKIFEEIPSGNGDVENAIIHSPDGQVVFVFQTVD